MPAFNVADRGKLARLVSAVDAATLDLISRAVFSLCIISALGVWSLLPPEGATEQIFRQIAGWVVGSAHHTSVAQFFANMCVEDQ